MKKYVLTIILTLSIAIAHINSACAAIVIDAGAFGAKVNEVIGFIQEINDEVNKGISTVKKIKTEGVNKLSLLDSFKEKILNFDLKSVVGSKISKIDKIKGTKEKETQVLEGEKIITIEANKGLNSAQQEIVRDNLEELNKKEDDASRRRKTILEDSYKAYNIALEKLNSKNEILEKELEIVDQAKAYKNMLEQAKEQEKRIEETRKKKNEAKNKDEKLKLETELKNLENTKENIEKQASVLKSYIDDLSRRLEDDKNKYEIEKKSLYESIINSPEYVAVELELEAINRQKEIQEVVLDNLEEEGNIIGTADDPTVVKFEERQKALSNSEDAQPVPDPVEEGNTKGSSSKYQIKQEDYEKFVKTYFFDEKEIQNTIKGLDGEKAAAEIKKSQDDVKRNRKYLLTKTMTHLMQLTSSVRREIPDNTQRAKEVYDNVVSTDDLLTTIGYHSELRIEQARALLLYARIQAAKLQYLSAKEVHGAKLEKKGHKKGGPVNLEDYKVGDDTIEEIKRDLDSRRVDIHEGL